MGRVGGSYSNKTLDRLFVPAVKYDEYEIFKGDSHVVAMGYKDCDKDYYRRDIVGELWYTSTGERRTRFYKGYSCCVKELENRLQEVFDSEG